MASRAPAARLTGRARLRGRGGGEAAGVSPCSTSRRWPPGGINLYVLSGISGLRIEQIVRALLPFYAFLLCGLVLMTYFPFFSTWLPSMLR